MPSSHQMDPRSIVTPDAFELANELLGMPLASPSRRFAALMIDLTAIGLLTVVTKSFALVLGVVAAVLFIRAGFRHTNVRGSVFSRAMRLSVGCLGLFIGMITAIIWVSVGVDFGFGERDEERQAAEVVMPGLRGLEAITGLTGAIELQQADDAEEAAAAANRLLVTMEAGGASRSEKMDALMELVPNDADWADDADEIFARVIDERAGETTTGDAEAVDVTAFEGLDPVVADSLDALEGRVDDLTEDLEDAERSRAQLREALAEESEGGFVSRLWNLIDELGFGFGWASLYMTVFLSSWKGQTPGKKMMRIRVVRLDGQPITWWVAFERAGGYAAGFATGLLGFFQVYWDSNRQAIHDRIVGTVVVLDGAEKVVDWEAAL